MADLRHKKINTRLTHYADCFGGDHGLAEIVDDGVTRDAEIAVAGAHHGRQVGRGQPAAVGRRGDLRAVLLHLTAVQYPRDARLRIAVGRAALERHRVVHFGFGRADDRHRLRSNCIYASTSQQQSYHLSLSLSFSL